MRYFGLKEKIRGNIFSLIDVLHHFPDEKPTAIKTQLSRFLKKGLIFQIKRGLYCFDKENIDELILANKLYQPSYISLETALNYYGIIPDIPQEITSVTPITTKLIKTSLGRFSYTKIKRELFFGFKKIKSTKSKEYFQLAYPEKALLDYFYLRKIKNAADLRLDLKNIDINRYQKFLKSYPAWVAKIKL